MTNQIIPTREDLEIFIYERHKDAYGTKGRHYDFDLMSYEELDAEAIRIDDAAVAQEQYEAELQKQAIAEFEGSISITMEMANCDRQSAIYYQLDAMDMLEEYDMGYVCYQLNLPYFKGYEEEFEAAAQTRKAA